MFDIGLIMNDAFKVATIIEKQSPLWEDLNLFKSQAKGDGTGRSHYSIKD